MWIISFSKKRNGKTSLPSTASLSLSLSLVAAGLIGGFVTPALTGWAELRSQRFGNYPLTQQPTTAQMHSHTHTYTRTHIHGLHVNTSEMGRQAVCVFHLVLFRHLHICLSLSLISWARFRGEEGMKLRRLLIFPSNIQSILSHPGPELAHTRTYAHIHTHSVILGDHKGSSSSC